MLSLEYILLSIGNYNTGLFAKNTFSCLVAINVQETIKYKINNMQL